MSTPLVNVQSASLSPRQRILEVAARLFYDEGIHAVGIDRVIAESGTSKATLYRHFATKDDLVAEYVRLRDARYLEWLAERVTALAPDRRRRPLAVFDAIVERCESKEFQGCAFGHAIAEFPDPDHPAHRAAREHKAAVRQYLQELVRDAGHSKPETRAQELLLLLDGAVTTAERDRTSKAVKLAKSMAQVLLNRT